MGCLNSTGSFKHWFGNIHLSGPCNRSCYFCIGQWAMGQDQNNNLKTYPLLGYDKFVLDCKDREIKWIYLTGTNTDPTMHLYLKEIVSDLKAEGFSVGLRTNGHLLTPGKRQLFDQISISVTSFDPAIYKATMGQGKPPEVEEADWLNCVLCPETMRDGDIFKTILYAKRVGIKKINFREPYGQPRIGNPFVYFLVNHCGFIFGNPRYLFFGVECVYWDVHFTEVESINLYADGTISYDYPVSLGHSKEFGEVKSQGNFKHGRQIQQWN